MIKSHLCLCQSMTIPCAFLHPSRHLLPPRGSCLASSWLSLLLLRLSSTLPLLLEGEWRGQSCPMRLRALVLLPMLLKRLGGVCC